MWQVLTLTFLIGVVQLALGLMRMGKLVNFVSHTVVVGFTAGAALLIAASQVRNFFGIAIPRRAAFHRAVGNGQGAWDSDRVAQLVCSLISNAVPRWSWRAGRRWRRVASGYPASANACAGAWPVLSCPALSVGSNCPTSAALSPTSGGHEALAISGPNLVVALGREGKRCAQVDAEKNLNSATMAAKQQTDEGKADYRTRQWIAESPNGWINSVLGFGQFSRRGLHRM